MITRALFQQEISYASASKTTDLQEPQKTAKFAPRTLAPEIGSVQQLF
jgi:hypothetical protein